MDFFNYCQGIKVADFSDEGMWAEDSDINAWSFSSNISSIFSVTACKMTMMGKEYEGSLSVTENGRTCQRWDSQSPHSYSNNKPDYFPDSSLAAAENFCRNPDNEALGPWCYTTNPSFRWEQCSIFFCPGE